MHVWVHARTHTQQNISRQIHRSTHPFPTSRTLSVCWQTLLWGKHTGIVERLRRAVKKPLRHRATHTHTQTWGGRRDRTCSYCQTTSLLDLAPNYAIKAPQRGDVAEPKIKISLPKKKTHPVWNILHVPRDGSCATDPAQLYSGLIVSTTYSIAGAGQQTVSQWLWWAETAGDAGNNHRDEGRMEESRVKGMCLGTYGLTIAAATLNN